MGPNFFSELIWVGNTLYPRGVVIVAGMMVLLVIVGLIVAATDKD